MIRLKNVSKFYYNKGLSTSGFNKVSADFNLGEFVVITGESGSGKSTLLNVISGLDSYEEGEMYIDGKETSHYTEEDFENYRKKYISNIFQNFNLVNSYTVYQNIELILLINGKKRKEVKSKVIELIKQVDLLKYKNTKVSKLSGGQKQRVAIARALAKNTPIIVADEPTGNLDKKSAESVLRVLSEVAKDKLVVVVTHNYEQFEKYASRKITMYDGKIVEDKVIRKTEVKDVFYDNDYKPMGMFTKLRLGVRNAFNIVPKFLLLLAVFLFVLVAVISETSSFKLAKYQEEASGYNQFFGDISKERIVLVKKDKSAFTDKDYEYLNNLNDIDYIVKNDIELDNNIFLQSDNLYLDGYAADITRFKGKLAAGVMPKEDNEVIVVGNKDNYYLSKAEKLLNKELTYETYYSFGFVSEKIKIVGIAYINDSYDIKFYMKPSLSSKLAKYDMLKSSKLEITMNNKVAPFMIEVVDNLNEGEVYVTENAYTYFDYNVNPVHKDVKINVNNMYFNKTLDLKINKLLDKNNFKKYTGFKNYDEYYNYIFISQKDFDNLLPKENYQCSVFVKDELTVNDTKKILEDNGYKAIVVSDTLLKYDSDFAYFLNIINIIVTILLLVILFFISYLIIKIILKSRHVYYSTLRILGANKGLSKNLLRIELYTILNVAFVLIMIVICLINKDIIVSSDLKDLLRFMSVKDYVLIYLLVFLMTYLISVRFAKYLFKQSAMKTYNEEAI